tara:strand:+ start:772 stop:2466 length:1695 start_codon:yes stop_codon:yes gene_type:complete
MDFFYRKNNSTFENSELINIEKCQNYIPIYNHYFNLTENNYNNINLNNFYNIKKIIAKKTENIYHVEIVDGSNNINNCEVFIKFSPILDVIKYITNKYDLSQNLLELPKFKNTSCNSKILDKNNSAYIDGFFSFLISILLHKYNFINGIDFYGSFLAIKNKFIVNIEDDIDLLNDCPEFHENRNKLYNIDTNNYERLFNNSTKKNKNILKINEDNENLDDSVLNLSDINDLDCLNEIFNIDSKILKDITDKTDKEQELIYENTDKKNTDDSKKMTNDSSSCSSRSSYTENSDSDSNDDNSESSSDSDNSEENNIFINVNQFPVQLIMLENCNNTLDDYILNNKIRDDEWDSIVLQILFTLITYQKVFNMTHNDLHTNNIVYNTTDKKFIYYKFNDRHYKVPTFGKIYKIIDFGRAIYQFKGKLICSDSYHKDGDAYTQYNFEPYFNENKPRLEPNYSFDLCRLGCSLFDFLIDDLEDLKKIKSPIKKIILQWIIDDKDRNILYKNNGDERYPDFKLYKMIARSVHNHVPKKVLENKHFEKYLIAKKRINNPQQIINIDTIPSMI